MMVQADGPLPRHWQFAAVTAWDAVSLMLQDSNLMLPSVFLLEQLAAAFESDPLIQSDPQQLARWGQLRARIAALLAEQWDRDSAESDGDAHVRAVGGAAC